jgi:hypothetical protein
MPSAQREGGMLWTLECPRGYEFPFYFYGSRKEGQKRSKQVCVLIM